MDKKLGNTCDFCFQKFERLNFRAKNFLGQTNIGQRKPNYFFYGWHSFLSALFFPSSKKVCGGGRGKVYFSVKL